MGSSALIVRDSEKGYEVARFSLGSTHEAADMSHFINQLVRERKEGGGGGALALLRTKHAEHRCPKCGRALRRSGEVCGACIDRRKVMLRLFFYLVPYKWLALGGLALTFGLTTTQVLPPYLTKVLVDSVIINKQVHLFPIIVMVLIGIYVARSALAAVRTYVMQWLGNRVLFDLRVRSTTTCRCCR